MRIATQVSMIRQVIDRLSARQLHIAVAESATGGLLGHWLTSVSGSSMVVWGGIIAYANEVKIGLLGVCQESLDRWGAVSPQVALEMAQGAQAAISTDMAISITGIAGPTGATAYKPVGLYYIGVAVSGETWIWRHHFTGDRQRNNESATEAALVHLLTILG